MQGEQSESTYCQETARPVSYWSFPISSDAKSLLETIGFFNSPLEERHGDFLTRSVISRIIL